MHIVHNDNRPWWFRLSRSEVTVSMDPLPVLESERAPRPAAGGQGFVVG